MSSAFQQFKELHYAENLFVLPNAWDARSAALFQEKNFKAVGTSSAAVSTSLGYNDGEGMPFAEYLVIIKRILAVANIPVTIDIEMGYGQTNEVIIQNIRQLIELGVAGINIEDSIIQNSIRTLKKANEFAKTIEAISNHLAQNNLSLFINLRCDTYILDVPNKQKETTSRLKIYELTGADGIFLPCISNEDDISEAVSNTKLPLNVMFIPGLPGFDTLNRLGVKRASMGPFLFSKTYAKIPELSQAIINNNFSPIL